MCGWNTALVRICFLCWNDRPDGDLHRHRLSFQFLSAQSTESNCFCVGYYSNFINDREIEHTHGNDSGAAYVSRLQPPSLPNDVAKS